MCLCMRMHSANGIYCAVSVCVRVVEALLNMRQTEEHATKDLQIAHG